MLEFGVNMICAVRVPCIARNAYYNLVVQLLLFNQHYWITTVISIKLNRAVQASTIQKTMKEPLVSEHLDFPKLCNKRDMVNVVF